MLREIKNAKSAVHDIVKKWDISFWNWKHDLMTGSIQRRDYNLKF